MAKKVRNRTLAVKTTPDVKLTYYMYATQRHHRADSGMLRKGAVRCISNVY